MAAATSLRRAHEQTVGPEQPAALAKPAPATRAATPPRCFCGVPFLVPGSPVPGSRRCRVPLPFLVPGSQVPGSLRMPFNDQSSVSGKPQIGA
jgi:hypothetical protein